MIQTIINKRDTYKIDKRVRKKTLREITNDIETWLEIQSEQEILTPGRTIIERNIRHAYRNGAKKAMQQIQNTERLTMLTTTDWEALELLEEINFNRITDCTQTMQKSITYSMQRGILEGWGTNKIANEIRRNIKGNQNMGITRAKTIARTEIVNAYNQANQNKDRENGVKKYIWITSFDDRTCPECMGYDGQIFTVGKDIVPPAHPNCRCSTSPYYEKQQQINLLSNTRYPLW